MSFKIFALIILFLGELSTIYGEMAGSRLHALGTPIFSLGMLKYLVLVAVGGIFILAGYVWGYKAFNNIWIISALSVTSILILEPFLAYSIFKQLPTTGALIGFILGVLGLGATLVWK